MEHCTECAVDSVVEEDPTTVTNNGKEICTLFRSPVHFVLALCRICWYQIYIYINIRSVYSLCSSIRKLLYIAQRFTVHARQEEYKKAITAPPNNNNNNNNNTSTETDKDKHSQTESLWLPSSHAHWCSRPFAHPFALLGNKNNMRRLCIKSTLHKTHFLVVIMFGGEIEAESYTMKNQTKQMVLKRDLLLLLLLLGQLLWYVLSH